ncbi:MAG TPA: pimeloyl-CoA dehydrogenase large subunit [Gammaproteobacteria bacterium]|jgi:alkylation response protein AidB-like acyl-CoA dehydrogenase|nr:pimeloyl-CoA dehydrogenase large subunit [Gammaproteobacteria bacterium]|tara:strand:- start:93 stop:1304 length:1212 start_codon:yes stop_codon:yes gene_type:complete
MNLQFTQEELNFQKEVKGWIKENYPKDMKERYMGSPNGHVTKDEHMKWQQALYAKGWAGINWPKEYGGAAFTASQKFMFNKEMSAASAPSVVAFGEKMVAPVIMAFGSDEQKKQYLPDILASKVWWCQGYSEPGSGSDLASLKTKAEDKGDHYLINGAKTWTTLAQHADMIFCLVRTSQEDIRQKGISFILIDMHSPGIVVQPINTLDNTPIGHHEVNTVFFEDVKVPKENLIGEEGKGWTYAKYLLEFERGNGYSSELYSQLSKLRLRAQTEDTEGSSLAEDIGFVEKMAKIEVQINAMEATELRILGSLTAGQNVGPESSLLKARGTEIGQAITELAVELVGNYALPFNNPGPELGHNEEPIGSQFANTATPRYFNYRKASIYAGSNEIQRNIMAKLVLGL